MTDDAHAACEAREVAHAQAAPEVHEVQHGRGAAEAARPEHRARRSAARELAQAQAAAQVHEVQDAEGATCTPRRSTSEQSTGWGDVWRRRSTGNSPQYTCSVQYI